MLSLIITTYNRVAALELVLLSVLQQTEFPDEIIIADDGSTAETRELCATYQHSLPLIHCWQADEGFRAAAIRNQAIARARGNYLIVIDGDMILHPLFVHDHKNKAQKNTFVQGKRVLLSEQLTETALKNKQITFNFFTAGLKNRLNALHLPFLSNWIAGPHHPLHGIRSCNLAFWRADALKINGFNEDFVGWGREDSEFVARLQNMGVRRVNFKFGAIAYHLYHPEQSRICLPTNEQLLENTLKQKRIWCERGLNQYF